MATKVTYSSVRVQVQLIIWIVILTHNYSTIHAAVPTTRALPQSSQTGEFRALDVDYYNESCPALDAIVATTVAWNAQQNSASIPPLVRMFFHDCFVQGCDGSLLLESTLLNFAEKQSPPNAQVGSFDVIDDIKKNVEYMCPGVVSCADIIAVAAREAVAQSGGPFLESRAGPSRFLDIVWTVGVSGSPFDLRSTQYIINKFEAKGLDIVDLVALLGAHTFGQVHCAQVTGRLYGWTNSSNPEGRGADPQLDEDYAQRLRSQCPESSGSTFSSAKVSLDYRTPNTFDSQYYANILSHQGLLYSDAALLEETRTRGFVELFAQSTETFFSSFAAAMIKLGRIESCRSLTARSEEFARQTTSSILSKRKCLEQNVTYSNPLHRHC